MRSYDLRSALACLAATAGLSLGCGASNGGVAPDAATGGAGSDAAGAGGDTEPASMSGMTAAHNKARASVMPAPSTPIPPLVWSSTVAATAQAWANNCQFMHSGGSYGENIYAGSGTATPDAVVADWVSESASYDYATNGCSGTCGHYTQVVWAASARLGCGVANCTTNSPFGGGDWQFWVCNYDPPGNYVGQKPY
jgi:pathogenesis-related protein 1